LQNQIPLLLKNRRYIQIHLNSIIFFCSEYFFTLVDIYIILSDKFIVAKISHLFLSIQILNYQGIQFSKNVKTCVTIQVTNNKNNKTD